MKNEIKNIKKNLLNLMIEGIKEIGVAESARRLGITHSYLSRVVNKKQNISYEKIIEIIEKLKIRRDYDS